VGGGESSREILAIEGKFLTRRRGKKIRKGQGRGHGFSMAPRGAQEKKGKV